MFFLPEAAAEWNAWIVRGEETQVLINSAANRNVLQKPQTLYRAHVEPKGLLIAETG